MKTSRGKVRKRWRTCRLESLESRRLLAVSLDPAPAFVALPVDLSAVRSAPALPAPSSNPSATAQVFLDFGGSPHQTWSEFSAGATQAEDNSLVQSGAFGSAALYSLTSVPALSSYAAAAAKLYLDFDGAPAQPWGSYSAAETPAYDLDGDPTTFCDLELANIQDIWVRVAEAFSPFNIDVTTVDPGNRTDLQTEAVVIGGDGEWTGGVFAGVAHIGGFYNAAPNTVYVFSDNLFDDPAYTAQAAAHEAGHSFGLDHQSLYDANGTLINEYNYGDAARAPIMGSSYSAARGLWYYGPTRYGVTYLQDDLAIMTDGRNGWGFRTDDHGDTADAGTLLTPNGNTISAGGVISQMADQDVFLLATAGGPINVTAGVAAAAPMLDLQLALYDAAGQWIAAAATSSLSETLAATVPAGAYRLVVASQGNYGDIGQYTISGTLVPPSDLAAPSNLAATPASLTAVNLSWQDNSTGEDGFQIQRSDDNGTTWTVVTASPLTETTYQDTGRTAGASYLYRVRAVQGGITSEFSNVAGVVMAPPAPSDLTATAASTAIVNLAWQDNSSFEDGFKVQQSTNGGSTWSTLTSSPIKATTYQKTGLAAGTTYWYRVFAVAGSTASDYSNVAQVTTLPAAPRSPKLTVVSFSEIKVTWGNVAGETSYRIERATSTAGPWTEAGTVPADTLLFYSTGLLPATKYYFRVFAVNDSGSSAASSVVNATTPAAPIPAAPGDPLLTVVSSSEIEVRWSDVVGEASYRIERSPTGASGWTQVGSVPADVLVFADTGLAAASQYYYRVLASNSSGTSPASAVVSGITAMSEPAPSVVSSREIRVAWSDVAGESFYVIERSLSGAGDWTQAASVPADTIVFHDTGLTPQTTYYYRLFAVTPGGVSPASSVVAIATPMTPSSVPAAPGGLQVNAVSDSEIRVSWGNVAEEGSYRIERSLTGEGGWTPAGTVPADTLTFADTGLTAQTTYYYRVFAVNELGDSAASAVAATTTPLPAPAAPGNPAATVLSSRAIRVTWSDVDYESSYRIERSPTGTGNWAPAGTVPADTLAFDDMGLSPSTKYYYRVFAVNATGDSPASAVVNGTTPATPTAVPAAPSSPKATVISSSQIDVSWRDVSNELTYRVERSPTGSGDWTLAGTVPANTLKFCDTGLAASTKYYYRVFAVNELGSSPASAVVSGTTKAPPPLAPSDLYATTIAKNSVTIAWSDNSTNESGFKIERSTNGTTWSQVATTGANITSYTNTKLAANTTYYYRVRSYNAVGNSDYSDVLTVTTLA